MCLHKGDKGTMLCTYVLLREKPGCIVCKCFCLTTRSNFCSVPTKPRIPINSPFDWVHIAIFSQHEPNLTCKNHSLIEPHFLYASPIYDACNIELSRQLQICQNQALRAVLKVNNRYSTDKLHEETGIDWLNPHALKCINCLCKVHTGPRLHNDLKNMVRDDTSMHRLIYSRCLLA